MNSFLADTGRKEVDRRLWLQSTNKIEAKAEKTLKGQDKPVTVFMLNDFRDAQIEYPSCFADLHQAKVKDKPSPDPHQSKAIADATSGLKTSDRGQMIMACGTGKTFTTLWIKEALESHNTLVLLPSLSLLSQTMREWAWAGNTDFDILNVCSDKSVGKKTEDMDPADAPFPVTSEVEEIAKFLKQSKPKVIFCTYQSSDLISQAQLDEAVPDFDLAVADEAHRCAGKADAGFATILDADKIRASKRLFTTATPRYFGKAIKDAAKARDLAVVGMDDEAVFGPVIHKLTFGQAIEQELLTDYQVVIVGVDEPMVREWIENYEIVSTDPDNQTDARTLAAKIGMLKAIKDYDLKRVISFHSRVAGAKQFSDELVDVANLIEPANRPEGTFLSDYVSGAMKAGDRKEKIDRLKVLEGYDRGILTNARCLAEGVDVPSLDGVAFIDPRGSQVEIIQAVGRAIRKVRGAKVQKKGTIVLPVFIEDGDDHEASIEASNFKPVWDVLKALRSHDEVLADTLDEYRTNMAKNTSQSQESISDKIIFDMPVTVDAEFSSALRTVLVEASTESWEFWLGLLEQYVENESNCTVPRNYKTDGGHKLGFWAGKQRSAKDTMPADRINRLSALGYVWDPYLESWNLGFIHLRQYVKNKGHCRVKMNHTAEDGYKLGNWVGTQRRNKDKLSIIMVEKLEALGFVWDSSEELWEKGFSELQDFEKTKQHCRVPVRYKTESGFTLGSWVATQKARKDNLSPGKFERLNALGVVWDVRLDYWEAGFGHLKKFHDKNNHCRVKQRYKTVEEYALGHWVSVQRLQKNNLSIDQIKKLDQIGFIWDSILAQWETGFSTLKQFHSEHKHCRVSGNYKSMEGYSLGSWVSAQRANKDTLPTDQTVKLDQLGFIWDALTSRWEDAFQKLKEYQKQNRDCLVPHKYKTKDGFGLGSWVTVQRANRESLSTHFIEKLDELEFVWDLRAAQWEEGFSNLVKFYNEHKHCRVIDRYVSENGFKLSTWVSYQRSNRRTGNKSLTLERRQRLDKLGFIWDASKRKT